MGMDSRSKEACHVLTFAPGRRNSEHHFAYHAELCLVRATPTSARPFDAANLVGVRLRCLDMRRARCSPITSIKRPHFAL